VRRGNRYRYYISSALLHDRKSQGLTAPQPPWAAYGHAAAQASDLFEQLGRNSEKLIAVAGQLRAKRTNDVIDMLHNEDTVLPSALSGSMSGRAARRVFDRLVVLGAVRELTGRPAFRLYRL